MAAKAFLISKKTTIQRILTADRPLVLDKCYEKGVITEMDHINLRSINKGNEMDHVSQFINKIVGKGEQRCNEFLDLLKTDEDINEALPQLKDVLLNYTPSLPKPTQESSSTAKTDDVGQDRKPKPKDDELYPLKSKPTGLCFVINNVNFKDAKPRLGSDFDAEQLAKVFSWLGFRVLMCKDQTKDQMDEALNCLSASDVSKLLEFKVQKWSDDRFTDLQKEEVPTHGDAFICCILTHGDIGVVHGTDGEYLAIKDIKKTFKATDRSPLTNKPKVFLIQACQGGRPHGRVVLRDVQSDNLQSASIPEESDFLIGMSTVEDYEAYRQKCGSWYIQTVCEKMKEGCPSGDDMVTILHRVNSDVSLMEGKMRERPGDILKQMPEIRSTLRKNLVFSPHSN